jgi:NAD(P)-dependent dehydrogenase (short-subunit alcohol dehydrogenase family)
MKNVVITGSTRGIGFGMADAFLANGCQVVINGRQQAAVDQACTDLAGKYDVNRVWGFAADVTQSDQVEALWQYAKEQLGTVDIWINNAGLSHDTVPFWEIPLNETQQIIEVNLLGTIFGAQTAVRGMLSQGHGQIYNMEGFGSGGNIRQGLSLYGTSKAAVHYLTEAMVEETQNSSVLIGSLSPGMVVTDLLLDRFKTDPEALEENKRIFNIIADSVDHVAPWLVERMLNNDKHGVRINYLSRAKMMGRFLTAPFSKRDLFDE